MKETKIAICCFIFIIVFVSQLCCFMGVSAADSSKVWDGKIASSYASGSGSEKDPYIIKTPQQLALLAKNVNNGNTYKGKYFRLDDNIILNDTSEWNSWNYVVPKNKWTPIGYFSKSKEATYFSLEYIYNDYNKCKPFSGTFDGNGHVIRGVYCVSEDSSCGLFGASNGTVKNLGVVQSYIKGKWGIGGIVGKNYGTVNSCYYCGNVDSFNPDKVILVTSDTTKIVASSGVGVGGIAGMNAKTVINCYSKGYIMGTQGVGGIVGLNQGGSVTTCLSTADTFGKLVNVPVKNKSDGSVSVRDTDLIEGDIGAIVGYSTGNSGKNITYCYSVIDVKNNYGKKIDPARAGEKSSYLNFNFTSVWTMDVLQTMGMPTLKNVYEDRVHDHTEVWITTKEANCGVAGQEQKRCGICNEYLSEERVIAATGAHTPGRAVTEIQPTCLQEGKTIQKCTVCNTVLSHEKLPLADHKKTVKETPATCLEDGERKAFCSVCDKVLESEKLPATGHTAGETETLIAADCKTAGETQQKCVICNEVLKVEQIPLTEHSMGGWQTVKESNMLHGGQEMSECGVCGERSYRDIPYDPTALVIMICGAVVVAGGTVTAIVVVKKRKK